MFAQDPQRRAGLPWDWSHEHLVFGKTDDPAVKAILKKDIRAYHQRLRRNGTAARRAALLDSTLAGSAEGAQLASGAGKQSGKRDWSVTLGQTQYRPVNTGTPLYPAKYTFDLNATPDCLNDYVAFPTGAALGQVGPSGQASIAALNKLYSTQGGAGGLCGTAGPEVFWAYINANCPATTSSDPILSSPVISLDGKKVPWVTTTGKVQILTYGAGIVGVVAETVTNPACIGIPTGGDGASMLSVTLANAKRVGPSVTFSEIFVDYDSDSAYVGDDDGFLHKISPFFNAVGSLQEIAAAPWQPSHAYIVGNVVVDTNGFIEKCTIAGTSKSSGTPGWGSSWGGTTTDHTVTWTNIGSGGGWPVYVTGSSSAIDHSPLNAPILDTISKNVFVGDQNGSLYYVLDPAFTGIGSCANGISLYPCLGLPGTASPITPAAAQADCATAPTCMVMSNAQGFTDGLVVDASHALVMTQFSNADGTHAAVEQTDRTLSVFNSTTLGRGRVNALAHHTGAFDNTYFTDPTKGYYYICGPAPLAPTALETYLYRVAFTIPSTTVVLGGVNGTPLKLTATGTAGNCGPLTEIDNTGNNPIHDWLFVSLDGNGFGRQCAAGSCVKEFDLGAAMVRGPHAGYGAGSPGGLVGMDGMGGMIVDNDANTGFGFFPQASSIYFMPVSNSLTCGDGVVTTGCAVKLTQAGLR